MVAAADSTENIGAVKMKDPTLEHVLEILESQKAHIDKLEKQVALLNNKENNVDNSQDPPIPKDIQKNGTKPSEEINNKELKEKIVVYEERIQVSKLRSSGTTIVQSRTWRTWSVT